MCVRVGVGVCGVGGEIALPDGASGLGLGTASQGMGGFGQVQDVKMVPEQNVRWGLVPRGAHHIQHRLRLLHTTRWQSTHKSSTPVSWPRPMAIGPQLAGLVVTSSAVQMRDCVVELQKMNGYIIWCCHLDGLVMARICKAVTRLRSRAATNCTTYY